MQIFLILEIIYQKEKFYLKKTKLGLEYLNINELTLKLLPEQGTGKLNHFK